MGNVLQFPPPKQTDGGKARIKRQRAKRFGKEPVDDLVMLHADPEIVELPSDCA